MAECKYPFVMKNPVKGNPTAFSYIKVPCNKCVACYQRRSRQWIFRLKQELKVSTSAYFVTFTYDDENLVYCNTGIPTLNKSDFQKFMKRLRKAHDKSENIPIRYFMCGEYGKKTHRPHYHALIFNSEIELIEDKWNLGMVHIGTVTDDSIAYTTKYIMKENKEFQDQLKHDESFIREYSTQSKGIGKNYSESKAVRRYHKSDLTKNYVSDEKGFRVAMPRYYKDKIFTDDEREQLKRNSVREITKLDIDEFLRIQKAEQNGEQPFKDQIEKDVYNDYLTYKRLKNKNSKL